MTIKQPEPIDWECVQKTLESPFAAVAFKYKGHKISVVREYKNSDLKNSRKVLKRIK